MKKIEQLKNQVNLNKKKVGKELAPQMLSKVSGGEIWGELWIKIPF